MNKKIEIHTPKEIAHDLEKPEFVRSFYTDKDTVYVPVGELYGVKVLMKKKVLKRGDYLLLK